MKILNLYCGIGGNRKLWGDEMKKIFNELKKGDCLEKRNIYIV